MSFKILIFLFIIVMDTMKLNSIGYFIDLIWSYKFIDKNME